MSDVTRVDVLVVGGGTSGSAAAWQAARQGCSVLVVEESPWLGGMITAAGVSAFDGNKEALGSGLFRRLRDDIEAHYRDGAGVRTGWISDTCFEPHVAADLLRQYVHDAGAKVWHGAKLVGVLVDNHRILGARIQYQGKVHEVHATITVEATEYGDVLHMAKVPYRLGRESYEQTQEPDAPEKPDLEVQDMTWCATLKLHPEGAPRVPRPADYNPAHFSASTAEITHTTDAAVLNHHLHDFESFITYASLPNDKYLLNWPFHSNDYPNTIEIFGTEAERQQAFAKAKALTLAYVYYIQNDLKHPEWGLATDEYGTADNLPFMPYVRETRRVLGVRIMKEKDVVPVNNAARAPHQSDSIAIGDYFLDHHHSKAHLPPGKRLEEKYPKNAPFQIPYPCLVPEHHDGLLVAEKSISVTHIVNGCTRLQPVVMLIGQAVGAAAALCVKHHIQPRHVSAKELQDFLINHGVAIYPTVDVHNHHPAFKAIQRLSMRGLRFDDETMAFGPDDMLSPTEALRHLEKFAQITGKSIDALHGAYRSGMTRAQLFLALDTH